MSATKLRHRFHSVLKQLNPSEESNGERSHLLQHEPSSGYHGNRGDDDGAERPRSSASRFNPKLIGSTFWAVLKNSYINVLLVFVPFGIAAGVVGWPPLVIFVLNFLAIVPLASLLSFATEELAEAVGPAVGGLLNATFGNAIELIVSILALMQGQYRLVQASILGSVLVNIVLVLGCCFIAGGIGGDSHYDPTVASVMSALLTLSAATLIVPAILYRSIIQSDQGEKIEILSVSRGTAIIMIIMYLFYLYFQLRSHTHLFQEDVGEENDSEAGDPQDAAQKESQKSGEILGPTGAVVCLVLTTIFVGLSAEFLVNSIEDVVEQTGMTTTFIGIIILPIISNAAEHVTAVIVSWKGRMNLAILVDIGSGMQVALFVTPLLVLISWALGKPLDLHFQLFETVIFVLSVLVVNFSIRGNTSNYLEGVLCVGWYLIIALAFFYYPEPSNS